MENNYCSEYQEHFYPKFFEYTKKEPGNCNCASDRHSTQRYSYRWPCETNSRKCDFGLKYPETLEEIVKRYNVIQQRQREINKWRLTNKKCPIAHGALMLDAPDILEPRICCNLCRKCCVEEGLWKDEEKLERVKKRETIKGCLCQVCKRNNKEIEAIRNDPKVLADETKLEFFMREQERINRLQDQMEQCRKKLQPNKPFDMSFKDIVCAAEAEKGGNKEKERCHQCGSLVESQNQEVACADWKEKDSDPAYCSCSSRQMYENACVVCRDKNKNFELDCVFEKAKPIDCRPKEVPQKTCEDSQSGKKETTFCDLVCKNKTDPCDCEMTTCPEGYKDIQLPCSKVPCKHRNWKHLLYSHPGGFRPPQKGNLECIRDDFEVDEVNDFDSRSLQRRTLKACSHNIPSDPTFDYYLTTPDVHKLRYMQNKYMSYDDWYTVY